MTVPVSVEILIIGNEILIGEIQDTNTHWLCGEINNLGGRVARVTVLPDREDEVAAEVALALGRGVGVLITSGGLGPTADDLTLAAVARGAGAPLRLNAEALALVRERYDELAAAGVLAQGGLNAPREKMAWLPQGAEPVPNPAGTAPGVLLRVGPTAIVSLPGVPFELKAIFGDSLQKFLRETFQAGLSMLTTLVVRCNDESLLEPVLTRVAQDHPGVYVKSLATPLGESQELEINLSAVGAEHSVISAQIDAALHDLRQGLGALGLQHRLKQ